MFFRVSHCVSLTVLWLAAGCAVDEPWRSGDPHLAYYLDMATGIEYADVAVCGGSIENGHFDPRLVEDGLAAEFWDLPLAEAIHSALNHSQILRDLGASVLRLPDSVRTVYDPAIQETDPIGGIEAALSEFDAMVMFNAGGENRNRQFNNRAFGLEGLLVQDLFTAQGELTKRSVTGGQFSLRHGIFYDANNSITNRFPHAYDAVVEAEIRQPLLQGAGIAFNRLAGPGGQPGVANGVLIARVRTDISLAEFEIGVRDFLADVDNAYWDLYFAYRNLDALRIARDASRETLARVEALYDSNALGGEASNLAQAREQFYRFQQDLENAQKGQLLDGTRTYSGSSGGTFRGTLGVRTAERRLRLLIGLPGSDGRLIRPADEPLEASWTPDWHHAVERALVSRPEQRRQRWIVKQRELELLASRNYLLPNADLVGQYRLRGFGEYLCKSSSGTPSSSAYSSLFGGDYQEWQLGVEVSAPIGFRRAFAAVRNAQLKLARARTVLEEQQRQILHDLGNASAEIERAYRNVELGELRMQAAHEELRALHAANEADRAELYLVLDAQRRFADAASRYFLGRVEYALAVRNFQYEQGTLLEYYGVSLAEGPWAAGAYADATRNSHRNRVALSHGPVRQPPVTARALPGFLPDRPAIPGVSDGMIFEVEPLLPEPAAAP